MATRKELMEKAQPVKFADRKYRINDTLTVTLGRPAPVQKKRVVEIMEDCGLKFADFQHLLTTMSLDIEIDERCENTMSTLLTLAATSDMDARIFAAWAKAPGMTPSETYELHREKLEEWFLENGEGTMAMDFFGACA